MSTLVLISRRDLTERNSSATVGEFRWNDEHQRHLLQGQGLSVPAFNAWALSPEWDRMVDRYGARLRLELVSGPTDGIAKSPQVGKAMHDATCAGLAACAQPIAKL